MGYWIARRLILAAPVLVGITILTFALLRLAPGDPVRMSIDPILLGGANPQEYIQRRRAELRLDQPLPAQYIAWLEDVARGNLGYSFSSSKPVTALLGERFGPSLLLAGTALLLSLLLGVPLGVAAAFRQYSAFDYASSTIALLAISVPSFFLSLGAIYLFALQFRLLPSSGMVTPGGVTNDFVDLARHMVLPVGILTLLLLGTVMRYVRASTLEVLNQEYVTTARSKGLSARAVDFRHALPNALIPLITVVGLQIPYLAGGTVVIEQIYSWPGLGQLALSAISARDYPVIMGFTLLVAVLVLVSNIVTDLAYSFADPRIRLR